MGNYTLQHVIPAVLNLTPERQAALIAEVDAVVHNTLELRRAFAASGRQLDKSAWKLVATRDDVRAYRSRRAVHGVETSAPLRPSPTSPTSSSTSSSSKCTSHSSACAAGLESDRRRSKPTGRPPAVVLSGTVDGTEEDAVLGLLAHSEQHCMMRHSYLGTELEDARLLCVLARPTAARPFDFLGVKWGRQTYGRFSQPRDFVFLEATGTTTDADGAVVGYSVRQSTDLSDVLALPRSPDVLRGHLSVCHTFANTDTSTGGARHRSVEMFSRAFLQLDGGVPVNVAAAALADKLLALVNTAESATAYKLTWMMRQALRHPHAGGVTHHCANCVHSLCTLSTLLLHRGGACQVCRRAYCGKCAVTKKISISIGSEVVQKSLLFCLECLLEAKHLSARQVAADQQRW
ncbi:unnamed protein product [Hyaloperonospora brassicae]|uniref:FYVE-type domain-containing protein n=1 Tax=Hyaloperonospora brassicae TaxID=162125 RepID=A0AAV0UAA9_HYABA|nr:unnamed protein product [Hyaloperonospora brassicae]